MLTRLTLVFVLAIALASNATAQEAPVQTIASLDVNRYVGTWYEIAKYPNRFQKQCASHTRAQYLTNAEGSLQVINRCVTREGETLEAIGQAHQVGGASSPKLQVRFAPAWLSWLPWVWGDYWVIDLDKDYQLAAVSDAKREYLWVLSRHKQVDAKTYQALLTRMAAQGFDIQKLELSPQP
jgi:apolipoprotein D and lipocalin family protein